ncbi:17432_t:CDS:1, partial [Racocetra fulgida]
MDTSKYIINKKRLINDIYQCSEYINNNVYQIESKSYYKDLYKKLSKQYSLLLSDIGANKLYFNYQKQTNSNSLFKLLSDLKRKVDSSYDIEKAKKEFKNITSPSFFNLTEYFKDIVNKNLSSKIYYRYNSNCDITNHLSLEQF